MDDTGATRANETDSRAAARSFAALRMTSGEWRQGMSDTPMPAVPLSNEARRRVDALFDGDEARQAAELLVNECGPNLPLVHRADPISLERLRYAALKLSGGRLDALREAVELARIDWRDLLMGAGFGYDVHAHEKWIPERRQ